MWDKIPLFQHPTKPKAKKLFAQLEEMLEKSLKSKDFKEADFLKLIVDEHLCETKSQSDALLKVFTDYLVAKNAPADLCMQVTSFLLSLHQTKPVYHQSMFFPSKTNILDMAQVIRRA